MAVQYNITQTGQIIGDGTKPILISLVRPHTEIEFGFGDTEPTLYGHKYEYEYNNPLVIGTDFGKLWVKSLEPTIINVTVGV